MRNPRQSFLVTNSFAPMRPIVATREIETQTESEPLKTFSTMDTQTEQVVTSAARTQTEQAEVKEGSMQTSSTLTDEVNCQTDPVPQQHADC